MRFTLITILSLISSISLLGQEFRHTFSEAFRRPAYDVALDSGVIWIADGYGVTVASREAPPRLLSSLPLGGTTTRIAREGSAIWVVSGTSLHQVSWDGESIRVENSRDLGEQVFDIVAARGFLYLATREGVVQIDPAIPASRLVLGTTAGIAASLVTEGNTLVAADGDSTADVYNIEFPALAQKIGVANLSITGANRVHDVDGNLLVSNGRDSQMFDSLRPPFTSLGVFSFGASSAGVTTPGIVFTAGQDTTVRLVDLRFSAGRPAVVFEERINPSSGTLNQILRIRADANQVFLAAGDLGLRSYDLVDFGVPFPVVRSLVSRADDVVDLGNGQIVATGGSDPPRLYTVEDSGGLRETTRWEDLAGVTVLDHLDEVAVVATGGTIRLVRPSGTMTGEFSFGAAVTSGVVLDETIWVTLFDETLWRVPFAGGSPERVDIAGSNPSFVARGANRLILGSFNEDGTTTLHEVDRDAPSQSASITIDGLATSGAGVGAEMIAVATFRGLSLVEISGSERVVPLGVGVLPRALEIVGDEVIVVAADRVQRRRVMDGSLIREIELLAAGSSATTEDPTRVIIGSTGGIYTLNLDTVALPPEPLGRLRQPSFFTDMIVEGRSMHLVEDNRIDTRVLQNQAVSSSTRSTLFDGDLVDLAATSFGYCGLEGRGRVDCFNDAGQLIATSEIPALEDVSYLSIHGVDDLILVSLLEGCLGSGCRKRTVVATVDSGAIVITGAIDGEIVALSTSDDRIAVVTDLPRELRLYDFEPESSSLSLAAANPIDEEAYAVELDGDAVYLVGEQVIAFSVPDLREIARFLEPFDPTSGLSAVDQRLEVLGDFAVVTGRSREVDVFRIDAPGSWTLVDRIELPGVVRRIGQSGSALAMLTGFSIELLDLDQPPERRRSVGR